MDRTTTFGKFVPTPPILEFKVLAKDNVKKILCSQLKVANHNQIVL